jgi:hypothetical protein
MDTTSDLGPTQGQTTCTVVYYLSPAGQRAAALAGKHPAATQVLHVGPGDPAYAQLVEQADPTPPGGLLLGIGGAVRLYETRPSSYGGTARTEVTATYAGGPIPSDLEVTLRRPGLSPLSDMPTPQLDAPLTDGSSALAAFDADAAEAESHLARKAAAAEERAAKQRAADEERRAKDEARLPEVRARWAELVAEAQELGVDVPPDPEDAKLLDTGYNAPLGELFRAVTAARKRVEAQAYVASRATWVAEHGSDHLAEALELDLECDGLYREERLALERPGWVWEDRVMDFPEKDPRNPTPGAVTLLRQAREVEPAARLVWAGFGFVAGGVDFLGEEIWLARFVDRDGSEGALRELDDGSDDEDE